MTKKFCTVAAAVFALLTSAAPARAAAFILESLDLNFGNGYQAIGDYGVGVHGYGNPETSPFLYFDSSPLSSIVPVFTSIPGHTYFGPSGSAPFGTFDFAFSYPPPEYAPTAFFDFSLNGVTAVSGDVSCVAIYSDTPNLSCSSFPAVVPLPATLPLFASGVIVLAGFAAWRKGKVSP